MAAGIGFDLHKLVPNRPLRLGGVTVPSEAGFEGHSDGDVVLHALVDALLGATCGGDIGEKFPDTDPQWRGVDSAEFVRRVMAEIGREWEIENIDVTILLERPKLSAHKEKIAWRISEMLGGAAVNVKAKTMEGLGEIGEGRAGAAQVIASLRRRS